ncbi:MAG TPA: signal peptidase I [Steroidobacteraceae bacterium]|jgi:signal peptidase I|nr:signal peptidase I [Steroidobacteraceae bacterium]
MKLDSVQPLITLLAFLALPVVLVAAYDKWVLAPKRPRSPEGEVAPGPGYTRVANFLLPFALLAVVAKVGVALVFGWVKDLAVPLSLFAAPIAIWCAIDSWLLAPRRKIAAGSLDAPDPPLLRAMYTVLPVFVLAPIVRMISAETLDFSLVLLLLSVVTGLVWLVDHLVFRKRREQAAANAKPVPLVLPEPGTVDYARSFFPVAFIVLIVRAFIFEPFRIPSDSMMPTLLDGDFIVVNKFAYGLRWPVINEKFLDTGTPQRGDVVVFRYPPTPSINYIKRLVGLPGDRIEVHNDHLVVNGQTIALEEKGNYTDGCYLNFKLQTETLGEHTHQVLSCQSPTGWVAAGELLAASPPHTFPACDRKKIRESSARGMLCEESAANGLRDSNDYVFQGVVPAGHYVMIGDNRDNSGDSRAWGLVPDANVVGKATRIWFNFDLQRGSVVNWSRIGNGIQ